MSDQPSQPTQQPQPDQPGPPGGWYTDPHEAGRLRYWDGSTWTEYLHEQVPFAPPVPAPIAARHAVAGDGSVNDIGEWLRSSFRVALSNAIPGLGLLLLGLIPFLVAGFMMFRVLGSASEVASEASNDGLATTESFFTSEFDFTSLAILGVSMVLAPILLAVVQVGLSRLLYGAHVGEPIGFGKALSVGFTKGWRLVGWFLALYLGFAVVMALGAGLAFLMARASNVLAVVVGALLYLSAMALGVWFGVRLVLLPVACAVVPSGASSLKATSAATKGRFLAVLGRVMLLGLLSYLVILPFQIVVFGLMPILMDTDALSAVDPELVTPGEVLGSLSTVFGLMMLLYVVAFSAYQLFSSSAMARLYVDLGGLDSRS